MKKAPYTPRLTTDPVYVLPLAPAVISRYGSDPLLFGNNAACQGFITAGPPWDARTSFALYEGEFGRAYNPRAIVDIDDVELPDVAPTQTTVYANDLVQSVRHHMHVNEQFYFSKKVNCSKYSLASRLIWWRAVNWHLFSQFHAPDVKNPVPTIPSDSPAHECVTLMPTAVLPWDIQPYNIVDFLRPPTYTDDILLRVIRAWDISSRELAIYILASLLRRGTSTPGVQAIRLLTMVTNMEQVRPKIPSMFGRGPVCASLLAYGEVSARSSGRPGSPLFPQEEDPIDGRQDWPERPLYMHSGTYALCCYEATQRQLLARKISEKMERLGRLRKAREARAAAAQA